MTQRMLALVADGGEVDKSSRLFGVAQAIARLFERGEAVTRHTLKRLMHEGVGGSDADGAWSMREAFDALETAQVLVQREKTWPCDPRAGPEAVFAALRGFERALPTQTYRSEGQVEMQQMA